MHHTIPGDAARANALEQRWMSFTGGPGIVAPVFVAIRAHVDGMVETFPQTLDRFA